MTNLIKTREEAKAFIAAQSALRTSYKAQREAAYAAGNTLHAIFCEDALMKMVEMSDKAARQYKLPIAW